MDLGIRGEGQQVGAGAFAAFGDFVRFAGQGVDAIMGAFAGTQG